MSLLHSRTLFLLPSMLTSAGGGPWCFRFLGWSPWSEERTTFTYLGDPKTYLYRLLFFSRKLFWSQKWECPISGPKRFHSWMSLYWMVWMIYCIRTCWGIHWKPLETSKPLSNSQDSLVWGWSTSTPETRASPQHATRKTLWISMDTPQKESVHLYL